LLIEGWRFVPHSYALVAQSHCLSLLRRSDIDLRFLDLPYYYDTWQRTRGVFAPYQEQALVELRAPEAGFIPDAIFSVRAEGHDFSAPRSGRKFVFGTPEYRVLKEESLGGVRSGADITESISIVTPSRWSALAYEHFGIPLERVHVVPHGIDPAVLHPDERSRTATRNSMGTADNYVYMSAGVMTWNKGIDVLLRAFAHVVATEPDVRLFLKGVDALFPSKQFVRKLLDDLPSRAREAVVSKLIYNGHTFSSGEMANLLRAADVYVSSYRAEGFNLPVLEAMACGVPVICTSGGATDDFTDPSLVKRIHSQHARQRLNATQFGDIRVPDLGHLIELMRDASRNRDQMREMGARAAEHVQQTFTWDAVTGLLLERLFPDL